MATINSKEKSKKKTTSIKATKKSKITKEKKIVDSKKKSAETQLQPLSPQLEKKLNRSFNSVERYLKGLAYSVPIFVIFSLYWVFKSNGNITTILYFLFLTIFSIGIIYSYHLFSQQSKKSLLAFSITFGITVLFSFFSYGILNLRPFSLADVFAYIFGVAILLEMFRLKKYDYLY